MTSLPFIISSQQLPPKHRLPVQYPMPCIIFITCILLTQISFIRCKGDRHISSTERSTVKMSSFPTKPQTISTPPIKLIKRAGNIGDNKLKKTMAAKLAAQQHNRSHEALSHEGSEREAIVYVPDKSGYVPIASFHGGRPAASSLSGSISPTSSEINTPNGYNNDLIELDAWRPDLWDRDYNKNLRFNNTKVQHIEAECQDDYMKIRVGFNGSFGGLLYSAGYAYDPDCLYINGTGRDYYEFYIQLNRCGTLGKNALHDDSRKSPTKNFMWNTITVQYNPLIEEEFDEHFKVTCEYGYDFWKTVTFPFLDVEVATGNPVVFTLSPPECYMEIRNGYGTAGNRVTGPVRVGDPLTLIIYMRSKYDGFDIVINDCFAHNGATKRIQLIDEYGCPIDDKLISRFHGSWSDSGVYETQVYAYMKTFRFTGSPALYIECDVRMCHGRCPGQPCHWRNLKAITKRDVKNINNNNNNNTSEGSTLSENISLFQSLRVLQEEENDDQLTENIYRQRITNDLCVRTTTISAVSATFSLILFLLSAALLVTCNKLRYRNKNTVIYDTYVTHKGQLD